MTSKLNFMNHLLHLDDSSLAKQIQFVQQTHGVKGLVSECKEFINNLKLPNCFQLKITKNRWKRMVSRATARENEKELRQAALQYKKMKDKISEHEEFGCKEYVKMLPINQSRTLFQHKYSMMEHVKMNYKGTPSYASALWKCEKCGNQDTSSHLLWCSGYSNLREGINFDNDRDLCKYLQRIFALRCKDNNNQL